MPGKGEKRLSLTQLTAIFASANMIATGLRLVSGILISKLVAPSVLGLYNGIGLVRGYVPFAEAGVAKGLNRELPYFVGKGDDERAKDLAATAHGFLLTVALLAVTALLGVAGWYAYHGRSELAIGWASFSIPVFSIIYGRFYLRTLYRTHGAFPRLSLVIVVTASIGLVTVPLVWWQGFAGLCLRGMVVAAIMLLLLWRWRPLAVKPQLKWLNLKTLLGTGIPIYLVGQLYAWWPVLNETLVLKYTGTTGLGLYAMATLAGPTVAMFPQALGQVVYPRMAEEYGRTGRVSDLVRMTIAPTLITAGATLAIVTVAWFSIPPLIAGFLPQYVEGAPAAQWAVVAALVLALNPVNNVFNVVKKQARFGTALALGMLAYYLSLRYLSRDGISLAMFPQAMIIGRLSSMAICYVLIGHMVLAERRDRGKSDE